MVLNP
ncbi:Protein of unknown function [Lactobacillus helveticus CIRM-BIA 104]